MHYNSLQILRAYAVCSVVVYHMASFYPGSESFIEKFVYFTFQDSGVDLFFVLSGFVISLVSINSKKTWYQFIAARFNRVVPIYWFWTTIFAFIMWHFSNSFIKDEVKLLSSYFFIPIMGLDGNRMPTLSVGWSLNYEIFFYLLFGLFWFFKKNLFIITFVFFIIFYLISSLTDLYSILFFEFIFGIIAYKISKNYKHISTKKIDYLLLFFGLSFLFGWSLFFSLPSGIFRVILWGGSGFLIVLSLVSIENRSINSIHKNIFTVIGDASYTIYLTHWFFGFLLLKILPHFLFAINYPSFFILLYSFLVILAGMVFYYLIEIPIIKYAKIPLKFK